MSLAVPGVFRSRSFSLFFTGQALSYVGDGLRTIAIPLLVYHLTVPHRRSASRTRSSFFRSPFSGSSADRSRIGWIGAG